jgi:23S rRNA pseudouridine1911/1915/1917 synthase
VSPAREARARVPAALHGERLDKALAALIPELSRHKARKILAMGAVHVNGRRVRMAGHLMRTGDTLRLAWHDDVLEAQTFPLEIIYEDAQVVVVLKPEGQLSQGSELGDVGSLTHALAKRFGPDVRLMHRLDRGTSGLMVAARTQLATACLTPQFREHTILRRYVALLAGELREPVVCEARLRQEGRLIRVAAQDEDGMTAWSRFVPLGLDGLPAVDDAGRLRDGFTPASRDGVTPVEVELRTGRTHQIRVHAAHLGAPVVGDTTYGGPAAPRVMLHAAHLAFTHPDGRRLAFGERPHPQPFPGPRAEAQA